MSEYRVDISEPAENDLRDIMRYISAQLSAPTTATELLSTLERAIAGLSTMPLAYPPVTDERLASMGYRKLVVKNYIVFFSVNEGEKVVDVERILYGRRDWLQIL